MGGSGRFVQGSGQVLDQTNWSGQRNSLRRQCWTFWPSIAPGTGSQPARTADPPRLLGGSGPTRQDRGTSVIRSCRCSLHRLQRVPHGGGRPPRSTLPARPGCRWCWPTACVLWPGGVGGAGQIRAVAIFDPTRTVGAWGSSGLGTACRATEAMTSGSKTRQWVLPPNWK